MERRPRRASRMLAVVMALGLLAPLTFTARAHEIKYFWKYDPRLFKEDHTWKAHAVLKKAHRQWHARRPGAGKRAHRKFHHQEIDHRHQKMHYHEVLRKQRGVASWYEGELGACGKPLKGLYAAHPKWPCGSLVSVRKGGKHIFVKILDRGPNTDGRIIDLSKRAFKALEDPSAGLMDVRIYRLRK